LTNGPSSLVLVLTLDRRHDESPLARASRLDSTPTRGGLTGLRWSILFSSRRTVDSDPGPPDRKLLAMLASHFLTIVSLLPLSFAVLLLPQPEPITAPPLPDDLDLTSVSEIFRTPRHPRVRGDTSSSNGHEWLPLSRNLGSLSSTRRRALSHSHIGVGSGVVLVPPQPLGTTPSPSVPGPAPASSHSAPPYPPTPSRSPSVPRPSSTLSNSTLPPPTFSSPRRCADRIVPHPSARV
jgi:hypothetical protein